MAPSGELELSEEHAGIIELPSGNVVTLQYDGRRKMTPAKVDRASRIADYPQPPRCSGCAGCRVWAARGLGNAETGDVAAVRGQFPCPITV